MSLERTMYYHKKTNQKPLWIQYQLEMKLKSVQCAQKQLGLRQ